MTHRLAEVEKALLSRWPENRLDPTLDRISAVVTSLMAEASSFMTLLSLRFFSAARLPTRRAAELVAVTAQQVLGPDRVLVESRMDTAIAKALKIAKPRHRDDRPVVLVTGTVATAGQARSVLIDDLRPISAPSEGRSRLRSTPTRRSSGAL